MKCTKELMIKIKTYKANKWLQPTRKSCAPFRYAPRHSAFAGG